MVVFPKRPNTCGAELDPLILKQYIGTVIIIKEFTAGDFKASHIKISRNQCDARGQGCIRLLLIGWMDTGGRLVIPQQLGRQRQTSVQPHPQGGLHAPAADMRLLLSHGGLKRKRHLGIVFEGEDTFALKEHPDRTG